MTLQVHLRHARPADASSWEKLRAQFWPDGASDHGLEIASFFAGALKDVAAVLIAENSSGEIVGFAELSLRTDLPGLAGQRVGYVEGLYVLPEVRGSGLVRILLRASRDWARDQNCSVFASDRSDRIIVDESFSKTRS